MTNIKSEEHNVLNYRLGITTKELIKIRKMNVGILSMEFDCSIDYVPASSGTYSLFGSSLTFIWSPLSYLIYWQKESSKIGVKTKVLGFCCLYLAIRELAGLNCPPVGFNVQFIQ